MNINPENIHPEQALALIRVRQAELLAEAAERRRRASTGTGSGWLEAVRHTLWRGQPRKTLGGSR